MNLIKGSITIRNAMQSDAQQLCTWWNDGKIMAHAGFPNGLGITADEIRTSLTTDNDETLRRHIIELDRTPIGEMNYRNKGSGTAEIGIKICDTTKQEKGLGTAILSIFIDALFTYYGYKKITLDTNTKNKRAQHVYENKLGFIKISERVNAWQDQLGEMQYAIDYELTKENWQTPQTYIHIRQERPADHHTVEAITREAFWSTWADRSPRICDEHLLVHRLRKSPIFVPELNLVAEFDGNIAGHIIYAVSNIVDNAGNEHKMLTFGPLTVHPEYQNRGIGKHLMQHSFKIAKDIGYRSVIIFGHPEYYPRVGFRRAAEFGITTADGTTFDAFMAYPLYENALEGIQGRYITDPIYETLTQEDAYEFDKRFPSKPLHVPTPINVLLNRLKPPAREAIQALKFNSLAMIQTKSERELLELGIGDDSLEIIRAVMRENLLKWGKS